MLSALFHRFALVDFGLAQRVSTLAEEPAVDPSSRLKQLSSLKDCSVPVVDAKQVTFCVVYSSFMIELQWVLTTWVGTIKSINLNYF